MQNCRVLKLERMKATIRYRLENKEAWIKELKNNNEQDKNIKEILYELVENIENIIISNLMNE